MSGRGAVVAAVTSPGALAVMSMDDTAQEAAKHPGAEVTVPMVRVARKMLAAIHGEPNDMDRARWKALTADEKREALDASKRKVLRP